MPAQKFSTPPNYSISKSAAETTTAAVAKPSDVNGNVWFCSAMYVIGSVSAVVSNTINESDGGCGIRRNIHTNRQTLRERGREQERNGSVKF